jgi:hypothetical protein
MKEWNADICPSFAQSVDGKERDELLLLQQRLESKIQVISPSIDMIELM